MDTLIYGLRPVTRYDRRHIAATAVTVLVPLTRTHGRWQEPTTRMPAYFGLSAAGLKIILTTPFRSPALGESHQGILDIWDDSAKAMSVRWSPLEVVSFRRGEWLDRLDYLVRRARPDVPADWQFLQSHRARRQ